MERGPFPGPGAADGGHRCSSRARPPGAVRARSSPRCGPGRHGHRRAVAVGGLRRARRPPRRPWRRCARPRRSSPSSTSRSTRPSSPSPTSAAAADDGRCRPRPRRSGPVDAYEPQLRAIAHSGYTGENQSRVAAFLTSDSAAELVQQMTTLDLIATHTTASSPRSPPCRTPPRRPQAVADEAAARAEAGLAELQAQQAQVQERVDAVPGRLRPPVRRGAGRRHRRDRRALAGGAVGRLAARSRPGSAAATAVSTALAQVGAPYVWGSSGPGGFDCSGLTSYAYAAAGVALPHSSRAQSTAGARGVARRAAARRPGVLLLARSATWACTSATG